MDPGKEYILNRFYRKASGLTHEKLVELEATLDQGTVGNQSIRIWKYDELFNRSEMLNLS